MFYCDEIIFSATTKCNLECSHCFVSRNNFQLDIEECKNFISSCLNTNDDKCNIEKIGFSGGEPFLYLNFITEICSFSIKNELMFDRLMTNGDWWKTKTELQEKLQKLYDSGFDGKIGLSYDIFHGQKTERIFTFIKNVYEIFNDTSCVEILCVYPRFNKNNKNKHKLFLKELKILQKNLKKIFPSIYLNIITFPQSFSSTQNDRVTKWKDKKWFLDDLCQNTGNIFFVHADGNIAPCCGFANENPELFIGTIKDSADILMKNAQKNKMLNHCFNTGLGHLQKTMQNNGHIFPGKTNDMCLFCDYICNLNVEKL
ncbi:MAG: radical SAM protein [Treponema sp.]|nr:radical SAM protein [Treponema sp.]